MNYWLLTTEFPPFYGGGIGTYCVHTSEMFLQKGFEVTIFIASNKTKSYEIEIIKPKLKIVYFNTDFGQKDFLLKNETRLSMSYSNIVDYFCGIGPKPDIVEGQEYLGIMYYVLQKKYLLYDHFKDFKIILTLHAPSFLYLEINQAPHYKFPSYWCSELEKACIRMADFLISPSQFLLDEIANKISLEDKLKVVIKNPYLSNFSISND